MNSLGVSIDQCIIGIFALVVLYSSFRGLNNCGKNTKLVNRIPLVLFFTASVGTLLLLTAGIRIQWSYALLIIGVAIHLFVDRRNTCTVSPIKLGPNKTNR